MECHRTPGNGGPFFGPPSWTTGGLVRTGPGLPVPFPNVRERAAPGHLEPSGAAAPNGRAVSRRGPGRGRTTVEARAPGGRPPTPDLRTYPRPKFSAATGRPLGLEPASRELQLRTRGKERYAGSPIWLCRAVARLDAIPKQAHNVCRWLELQLDHRFPKVRESLYRRSATVKVLPSLVAIALLVVVFYFAVQMVGRAADQFIAEQTCQIDGTCEPRP